MSEKDKAVALANQVLERFNADPANYISDLGRQFLRPEETAASAYRRGRVAGLREAERIAADAVEYGNTSADVLENIRWRADKLEAETP